MLSTSVVVTCGASGCDTDGTAEREDSAVDGVRWDDAVQSASAPVAFLIVIVLLTPAGAVAPQGMALNTIHGVSDLLAGILPLVSRVVEQSPTMFLFHDGQAAVHCVRCQCRKWTERGEYLIYRRVPHHCNTGCLLASKKGA